MLILFTTIIVSADIPALQNSLTKLQSQLTILSDTLNTIKTNEILHPAPSENKLPVKIERPENPNHANGWGMIKITYAKEPNGKEPEFTYEHNSPKNAYEGDCIISPRGSISWNWKFPGKTKTDHATGIQIDDVKALLPDADIFILSTGVIEALTKNMATKKFLEDHGKKVVFLKTDEAIKEYNKLVQEYINAPIKTGKRVAALIHSTC